MPYRFKNGPWIIGFLLWTGLLLFSGWSGLRLKNRLIHDLAIAEGMGSFHKDLVYRRWASLKGGIYVSQETTQPNPHLQHLPDRDVTTTSGKRLTLMNPAYMTREVYELAKDQFGVQGHITSLNVLRPGNTPDPWEKASLLNFQTGTSESISAETINGEPYLRMMFPMITEGPCLKCHGQQGYKVGDIRGGISVSVPLSPYEAAYAMAYRSDILTKTLTWLAGSVFIFWSRRYVKGQFARECDARQLAETSEKKYRMLFDQATVGFALSDTTSGEIIECNQTLAKMMGRTPENLSGMPEALLYPALKRSTTGSKSPLNPMSFPGGSVVESQLVAQCHQMVDVEVKSSMIELDNRPLLFSVFHDITERKNQERTVSTLSHAVEQSPAAILLLDLKGNVEYANKRFTELTGFTCEEAKSGNVSCLLPPDVIVRDFLDTISKGQKWVGEICNTRKDGSEYWEKSSVCSIQDHSGKTSRFLIIKEDITHQKIHEQKLEHLATHDALTGLANRTLLLDRLEQAMNHATRNGRLVGILLLDLNRFKFINDSLGHSFGDLLLKRVAYRLKKAVRGTDTVARLGGDEFVIILTGVKEREEIQQIGQKISETLLTPFRMGGREIMVSASIGSTVFPQDGRDGETLIRNADIAMYQGKKERSNMCSFHSAMRNEPIKILEMESELRQALKRNQLILHYQPKVELATGRIIGAEALLRWQHPERGMIPPDDFIPLAEETGEILPIGEWVLSEAVRQVKQWKEEHLVHCPVAVNISAKQFQHFDLTGMIENALHEQKVSPDLLELELTESMIMHSHKKTIEELHKLKKLGVSISLDDFGTGYSSLNYLRSFPVDFLKIDRSFITEINLDASANSVAKSIIAIAQSLGIRTIAEGVETKDQFDFLAHSGCFAMQGYYYAPPLEREKFAELLKDRRAFASQAVSG